LNIGRQLHSCSRINKNQIIVAGGRDVKGGLDSVEILDKIDGEWNTGPKLPIAISYALMVEHPVEGVVLVGGQSGFKILDTLYYLSSVNSKWTELAQRLRSPRRFHTSLMVPNFIANCTTGIITFLEL
jgi:hypothetical protein